MCVDVVALPSAKGITSTRELVFFLTPLLYLLEGLNFCACSACSGETHCIWLMGHYETNYHVNKDWQSKRFDCTMDFFLDHLNHAWIPPIRWLHFFFSMGSFNSENSQRHLQCLCIWLCLARDSNLVSYLQSLTIPDSEMKSVANWYLLLYLLYLFFFVVYNLLFLILHENKQINQLYNNS